VALSAGRENSAVIGVVVTAVYAGEHSANVVTRWTTQCPRSVRIALTLVSVIVMWTVGDVVVATANCTAQ